MSEILVPAVGRPTVVARGFGLVTGASEGWGGGVARCKSSRRRYVPIIAKLCKDEVLYGIRRASWTADKSKDREQLKERKRTFTNNQLIIGA